MTWAYTVIDESTAQLQGPLCRQCLRAFDTAQISAEAAALEQIARLRMSMADEAFLFEFGREHFSMQMLNYLYWDRAFHQGRDAAWGPKKTYEFLAQMLRKRSRSQMTHRQVSTLETLTRTLIRPYVRDTPRVRLGS